MGKNLPDKYEGTFVPNRQFRILQVSSSDTSGGAQKVAWNLFQRYREYGYKSWLAVGYKCSYHPEVLGISNGDGQRAWSRFWWALYPRLQSLDGNGRLSRLIRTLASPGAFFDNHRGIENFRFPGTWRLLNMTPQPPDVVHCHNLHNGYFDLQVLPWLSRQVPTVLTLHDAWLLSGHCAHSFECERWRTGCGECPDLTIYPAIRRDATAYNWQRKREIYKKSRLYIATPSKWLMQKVEQSMLVPAIKEARVIPNGVDLTVFRPADRQKVRVELGLSPDTKVLLFTANGIRKNMWKDYQVMRGAIAKLSGLGPWKKILFIALGEDAPDERFGEAQIRFIPYQREPEVVARYYQAADVYVHAAKADTFPNTILEALACGTPVVATAVGGIPEQVKGVKIANGDLRNADLNEFDYQEATGLLVSPGDVEAMADGIERLLTDDSLLRRLSENAAKDAARRFDLKHQVKAYLGWYDEILNDPSRECSTSLIDPQPLVKGDISQ